MNQVQVQETVSGFRVEGRWKDVVDTGETVTDVMKGNDGGDLEDWEEWRPREEERLGKELRDKTVEKACIKKNRVEQDGKTAVETAGEAVEDMGRAVEEVTKGRKDRASEKGQEAVMEAVLSVDTALRKLVRRVEVVVYRYVVTRTNPYYFDSDTVSASLQRKSLRVVRKNDEQEYAMSIEIHDGAARDRCRERIAAE